MSRLLCTLSAALLAVITLADAARAADKPHVFLLTQSKGFVHDVVKRKDGKPCQVEVVFDEMAKTSGVFTVEGSQDINDLTAEKLKNTRVVVFYTTGNIFVTREQYAAFDQWIKDGGLFMGVHPATDTCYHIPEYGSMIGGYFAGHPWNAKDRVTIKTHTLDHPATKPWGSGDTFLEEIYQYKHLKPESLHFLVSLDMEKTAIKKPYHVPISWCRLYGKGRVFYTSLGHRPDIWTNPKYQAHLLGGLKWLLKLEDADATPNPELHERENQIAKAAFDAAEAKKKQTSAPATNKPQPAAATRDSGVAQAMGFTFPADVQAAVQAVAPVKFANPGAPPVVTPPAPASDAPVPPPADAIMLFNGTDLSQWRAAKGDQATWSLEGGAMVVVPKTGYQVTRQEFGDIQLHLEFATPAEVKGKGQGRGNSGVFLMGRYEVQVLDSYENSTYADGQCGAIYKRHAPMVNASRPPGQWQSYDITFRAPKVNDNGELLEPARLTVLHNGVLIQDDVAVSSPTNAALGGPPHVAKGPIALQDHGNPVRYRNIWVRELKPTP